MMPEFSVSIRTDLSKYNMTVSGENFETVLNSIVGKIAESITNVKIIVIKS